MALRMDILSYLQKTIWPQKPEIIIFGDAKSGTIAAAKLLGKACKKSVISDLPFLWNPVNLKIWQNETTISKELNSNKSKLNGQIIKEPNLTFSASEVINFFPNCQFVFVFRSPHDQIRSQLSRPGLDGNKNMNLSEAIDFVPFWSKPMFQVPFKKHNPNENMYEYMALKWNHVFKIFCGLNDVRIFYYDHFVINKMQYIENFADKLGLKTTLLDSKFLDHQYQPKSKETDSRLYFNSENYKLIEKLTNESFYKLQQLISSSNNPYK